jgi:osmotically-inducible protein OsmY
LFVLAEKTSCHSPAPRLQKSIRFDAKNGVLTLDGSVNSDPQRQETQQLAQAIPEVQQVLNQIDVKR